MCVGLKQGNVRQEAWRQKGWDVRKETQGGKIDYEQQERDSSTKKETENVKE